MRGLCYNMTQQKKKAMTKTDALMFFTESRGGWNPGRKEKHTPIASEPEIPTRVSK